MCGPVDLQPSFRSPNAWMCIACFPGGKPVAFMVTTTGLSNEYCVNVIWPIGPPSALSPNSVADAWNPGPC